jgi:hypothetical protein
MGTHLNSGHHLKDGEASSWPRLFARLKGGMLSWLLGFEPLDAVSTVVTELVRSQKQPRVDNVELH